MEITVKYFGIIADFTKKKYEVFALNDSNDTTDQLIQYLQHSYSEIRQVTFSVAVNHRIIQQNTLLKNQDEVALLPPFAGG